jgi:hypothetical protein
LVETEGFTKSVLHNDYTEAALESMDKSDEEKDSQLVLLKKNVI